MNTHLQSRKQVSKNLRDKAYRDAFVEKNIRNGISFQIRALRDGRGWTQRKLAELIETKQEAISRMENPDYGRFTLETLRKLASVFDVALIVRFAPFSELVDRVTSLTPNQLNVPPFAHDGGLSDWQGASNVCSIFDFNKAQINKSQQHLSVTNGSSADTKVAHG